MPDRNWQKVREVFDAALRQTPDARRGFVIESCGGDSTLLAEIESLLSSLDSAEGFMETPAVSRVADAIEGEAKTFETGKCFGHYEIIKKIGSGGMGEVYLATDKKLARNVAIKILKEKFSREESNLRRFIQEAKAASALNHPNILVIHEIGSEGEAHYIVSEYIRGKTLRQLLKEKHFKLSDVLDMAMQIAHALTAAHEGNLVHRDIKPENIMIRPDGYVKVLDFGLAKLDEQKNKSVLGLENDITKQNHTAKGIILGTVNYMSPEQARGESVDKRTDIFSLGVLIYEMITGQTPFAGDSALETFANLINAKPHPMSRFVEGVPDELQRITAKMFRKNTNDRYQTMKGLLADLIEFRENLAFDEKLERSVSPDFHTTDGIHFTTGDRSLQSTQRLTNASLPWITLVTVVIVLAISGFLGFRFLQGNSKVTSSGPVSQRRLTVEGGATRVATSNDGRYAAVAQNGAVILFDLENGGQRVLVPASKDIRIMTIAFPPDGLAIYYGTRLVDQSLVSVYSMPLSGGEPTKIIEDIYGSLSFSPDGKKIALIRRYPEINEYALLTAGADGSNLNKLASSRLPGRFDASPVWSPDGKKIVCSAISLEGGFHFTIAKIDTSTGTVGFVPDQKWKSVGSISWLADSQRIVLAGQDDKSVNQQVWSVDTLTGSASRVTDDSFVYESISGTPDGRLIVAVKVRQTSHVWMLGEQNTQLSAGFDSYDGFNGLGWSKDGRIFYHSRSSGHDAIWRMRPDGSEAEEVTADAGGGFAISPDGQSLVFQNKQTADHLGLQLMNLADHSIRSLTQNVTALHPSFMPDGKTIVFSLYNEKLSLWEISVGGGQPKVLSDEFRTASTPSVSPSGKFIAFAINRVQGGSIESGIAVIATETDRLVASHKTRIALGSQYEKSTLQWSADESEVYFIQLNNATSNLVKLRLADGIVSNLTNFADGRIFNFAFEPDGNRILVARGFVERDATVLQMNQPL